MPMRCLLQGLHKTMATDMQAPDTTCILQVGQMMYWRDVGSHVAPPLYWSKGFCGSLSALSGACGASSLS